MGFALLMIGIFALSVGYQLSLVFIDYLVHP